MRVLISGDSFNSGRVAYFEVDRRTVADLRQWTERTVVGDVWLPPMIRIDMALSAQAAKREHLPAVTSALAALQAMHDLWSADAGNLVGDAVRALSEQPTPVASALRVERQQLENWRQWRCANPAGQRLITVNQYAGKDRRWERPTMTAHTFAIDSAADVALAGQYAAILSMALDVRQQWEAEAGQPIDSEEEPCQPALNL